MLPRLSEFTRSDQDGGIGDSAKDEQHLFGA
jgi:hypothetical protein